jgi:hypothetical protein
MSLSNFRLPSSPLPGVPDQDGAGPERPRMTPGIGLGLFIPSVNVFGAYFPDWMFCIVGALILIVPLHLAVAPSRWYRALGRLGRLTLLPSLSLLLALLGWVICFQS